MERSRRTSARSIFATEPTLDHRVSLPGPCPYSRSLFRSDQPHSRVGRSGQVAYLLADPAVTGNRRAIFDLFGRQLVAQDEQPLRVHRADEAGVRGVFGPLDAAETIVLGDASRVPQPDVSVRHRATDLLLDSFLKLDKAGTHLTSDARVLGVIPYYEAEEYLEAAIGSLVGQSRPLQGIVVIGDCSSTLPTKTLEKFPNVTPASLGRKLRSLPG